jgi:hypothetical protein
VRQVPKLGAIVKLNEEWFYNDYAGVETGEPTIVTKISKDGKGFFVNNYHKEDGECSPEYFDLVCNTSSLLAKLLYLKK